MNQIGPIFRDARTKSGKTIDEASRETKIAKKYLIGIENENFDNFPGETYLIGFIRNYAQFLGLDPDEMIRKYRDYKIQEQPAPIEQLTARPKSNRKYFVLALIVVIVITASLYFSLSGRKGQT
jgi:cytoskeleton protein RodZ